MKIKPFILLCVLFAIVLVSSTTDIGTSKDERSGVADKSPEEYHVNQGYGGGGGGWGGYGGGGNGWGGRGGSGSDGWGGPGGGGGGGWGGPGGGGGGWGGGRRWGCRFGCCGSWYRYRGCSSCCRSLTEAIAFNENEVTP
ncbi:hypothetical protein SSX86_029926 [Deinandra increscens subsp. villosa]|uniref:Uncharacterized protein n=1 Tax=Deinandra increscens subsp. villosa TaxID=3103831 RepID=A0AAP0GKJ5_9ASTR